MGFVVNNFGVVYFSTLVTFLLPPFAQLKVAFLGTLWLSNTGLSPEGSCQAQPSWWLKSIPELAECHWATWSSFHLAFCARKGVSNVTANPCPPAMPAVNLLTDTFANSSSCLQSARPWMVIYPLNAIVRCQKDNSGTWFPSQFYFRWHSVIFYHRNTFFFFQIHSSLKSFLFLPILWSGFQCNLIIVFILYIMKFLYYF